METTAVYWETIIVYWGNIGIVEKKILYYSILGFYRDNGKEYIGFI